MGHGNTSCDPHLHLSHQATKRSTTSREASAAGRLRPNPLTIRAHLTGSGLAVDPSNAPGTVTVQGDNCGLELDLRGCRFSRRKPSDPPEFGGPAFAAQFEAALEVALPTGEYFLFLVFARGN